MALTKGKDVINGVVKQIQQFYEGKIQPLKTDIPYIDHHLLGGFYPSTVMSIVALSQHGKTYELEKILTNLEKNHGKDTVFVKNLWELSLFKVVVREMAKITNQPVRAVLTKIPEKDSAKLYKEICDRYRKDNMYLQPLPVAPEQFFEETKDIIKKHPDNKIVVSIDNLENALLSEGKSQKTTMDEIIQYVNILNKMHPFIVFIILNQVNREYAERIETPKHHLLQDKDIYGSSALYKISDVVMGKILPYRLGLDKFLSFSNHRYKYIDDKFKHIGANTSMFDSIGNAFFQFLKSRDIVEEYDRKDLFVDKIFDSPIAEDAPITADKKPEFIF